MKVIISVTGVADRTLSVHWPKDWPPPREGEQIELGIPEGTLTVRHVVYYPLVGVMANEIVPVVYVVAGPRRLRIQNTRDL